ncbi:MAG: CvpA family protein [Candidatus Omnitrophota bacterium]|nr:CvpA family protein [Candidatus Omnitrophota bacterium]
MPQIKFNWVDIFFIIVLFRTCYISFKNGLLPEFFRISGLFLAFVLSFNNYILASDFLAKHARLTGLKAEATGFVFIFLTVLLVFKLLTVLAVKLLGNSENVSLANKMVGLMFGLARGILLTGLFYFLYTHSPVDYFYKSAKEKSFSAPYASLVAPFAYKTGMSFYPLEKHETPLVKLLGK